MRLKKHRAHLFLPRYGYALLVVLQPKMVFFFCFINVLFVNVANMNSAFENIFLLVVIVLSSAAALVQGVIPTAELSLRTNINDDDFTTLLVSQAFYGPALATRKDSTGRRLVTPPKDNPFLCLGADEIGVDRESVKSTKGAWMVVPRGGCTYERKTWLSQSLYETAGVIVRNTLASRYSFNETDGTILWPQEYHDYDCDYAKAEIPSNELRFFSKDEIGRAHV